MKLKTATWKVCALPFFVLFGGCIASHTRTGELGVLTKRQFQIVSAAFHSNDSGMNPFAAVAPFEEIGASIMGVTYAPCVDVLCLPYDLCLKLFGDKIIVLEEDGVPIEGVDIEIWGSSDALILSNSAGALRDEVKGRTNSHGVFRTRRRLSSIPSSYCKIFKQGYYIAEGSADTMLRREDGALKAMMQAPKNPLPLFVKRVGRKLGSESIAANGESFSYDLVKGAFLPPFGEGQIADIVFSRLPQEYIGEGMNGRGKQAPRYKNALLLSFQGDEANGVWESPLPDAQAYCWIRRAPAEGYNREISFSEATSSDLQRREGLDDKKCYCFRIRTNRDERGNIKSSLYGKIYGDPSFFLEGSDRWKQKIAGISFLYYLNPTPNDRNLEWDRKNNFCDKPGNLEKIVNHNPTLIP